MTLKGQFHAACFMNPRIGWICILIRQLDMVTRRIPKALVFSTVLGNCWFYLDIHEVLNAEGVPIIQITSSLSVIEYQGYYVYVTLRGIC